MRIKILMFGADPVSLMADAQLLREKGLLVITAFNMQNVNELVAEVRPDIVFFDPKEPSNMVTDAYIAFLNRACVPVIYTFSDDVYLITREKSHRDKRTLIADNILDALKIAFEETPAPNRYIQKATHSTGSTPGVTAMQLFG